MASTTYNVTLGGVDYTVTTAGVTYPAVRGATGANGLSWKGAWASGTAYVGNDAVSHSGSSYVSILAGTGKNPATETTYWSPLAVKASDGSILCGDKNLSSSGYIGKLTTSYNSATSFRVPTPSIDPGIFYDSWILGD